MSGYEDLYKLRKDIGELADLLDTCELDIYTKAGRKVLLDRLWEMSGVSTDLAKMYVKARRLNGDNADEVEDRARELAISFIVSGGYDGDDSDLGGDAMGDTVQTHLMIAFMRQPDMMRHHEEAMVQGGDKGEFGATKNDERFQVYDRVRPKVHADAGRPLVRPPTDIGVVTQVDGLGNLLVRWPGLRIASVTMADDVVLHKRPTVTGHLYDAGYPRDDSKGCIETLEEGGVETLCGQPEEEHRGSQYGEYTIKPKELRCEFANLFLVTGRTYKVTYQRPRDGETTVLIGEYDRENGDVLYFRLKNGYDKVYKQWIKDITDVG